LWRFNVTSALFLASIGTLASALIVALGRLAWTPIAERYLYMPSTTFVLGCVILLSQTSRQYQRWRDVTVAGVLCLAAVCTLQRTIVWSDQVTFLEDTVQKSPKFIPAYGDLANLYVLAGQEKKAGKLLTWAAEQVGEREFSNIDLTRAAVKTLNGDYNKARDILLQRLKNPGKNYNQIADALIKVNFKRIDAGLNEAEERTAREENLKLLLQMTKNSVDPFLRYRLGKAYLAIGDSEKAYESFVYAHSRAPKDSHYKEPARILAEKTRKDIP
jgi:tetratricopeptide (TPR) repeat protein